VVGLGDLAAYQDTFVLGRQVLLHLGKHVDAVSAHDLVLRTVLLYRAAVLGLPRLLIDMASAALRQPLDIW